MLGWLSFYALFAPAAFNELYVLSTVAKIALKSWSLYLIGSAFFCYAPAGWRFLLLRLLMNYMFYFQATVAKIALKFKQQKH
ncbi:MAG: hypothetical protein SOU37_07935 [Campylobacter lanienae]|nr:hypothetical protein [Campylobacteraceae bacterium]MDY2818522.1 hypothetical protein [Campylobacter lanienae]